MNPERTLFAIKRLIGRSYNSSITRDCEKLFPYQIVRGRNGDARIKVDRQVYSPSQVSAFILRTLKQAAEAFLGEPVSQAVITVPAYFDDSQRQATKDAGQIAGLQVLKIINEPTAAALACGVEQKGGATVVVYDLGGGSFDVSILEIGDGVFEVKSTSGDTFLGGEDFDKRIVDYLSDRFKKVSKIDLRDDRVASQRLKEAAEIAKIELSYSEQTEIRLPFITADESSLQKNLTERLTRARFEALVDDLIKRTLGPCTRALEDAGLSVADIDEVIMVGNMTRMPKVIETVKTFFGREPRRRIYPEEIVAIGAAINAGVLQGDVTDVVLLDVTPLSLGIETRGGAFTRLIDRNTTLPTKKSEIFSTADEGQTAVTIRVFQGEREMAADNKFLGQFDLVGIPPAQRGMPQIQVTFDIDANGIVNVSAKDKATGKEQQIRIQADGGLSNDDMEEMIRKEEEYQIKEQILRDLIAARDQAERLVYLAESAISKHSDSRFADYMAAVKIAISDLKRVICGENVELIRQRTKALAETTKALDNKFCKR